MIPGPGEGKYEVSLEYNCDKEQGSFKKLVGCVPPTVQIWDNLSSKLIKKDNDVNYQTDYLWNKIRHL